MVALLLCLLWVAVGRAEVGGRVAAAGGRARKPAVCERRGIRSRTGAAQRTWGGRGRAARRCSRTVAVADQRGAGLDPDVAARTGQQSVVARHHLALAQQVLVTLLHLVHVGRMDQRVERAAGQQLHGVVEQLGDLGLDVADPKV